MLDKRSYILLFCGLAGLLCYFYLRPNIDLYAGGPISESKQTIENRIQNISSNLGFSTDSLAMMTIREQHQGYINQVRDTLDEDLSLSALNEKGVHTQSWKTIIGHKADGRDVISNDRQLYDNIGMLKIHYANNGKLIRLLSHPENLNPTFLKGDSLQAIAQYLVGNLFGYNLDDYELSANLPSDTLSLVEGRAAGGKLSEGGNQSLELSWNRKSGVANGPANLLLKLKPVVREFNSADNFRTEFGFSVQSFVAKDEFEPIDFDAPSAQSGNEIPWFNYLFFGSVFILAVLIFSTGIQNIFRGKVEWRRALLIFAVIVAGLYGWRVIYFMNTYNAFLDGAGIFGTTVNSALFALVVGLYGALAYISWEALSRAQNQKQLDIIDAFWQRKVFISETGAGIIHGFGIGGITIGIFSVLVFLMGDFLIQTDSQFGFAEASISPKLLTLNISAFTTTLLVCTAQIGAIYVLLNHWIKKQWLSGLLAILFVACFTTVLGRLIGTTGEIAEDALLYLSIAIIFVYAIREFGLLTVCTGWWFFVVFFMIQPYWNSPIFELAYVSWAQALIMSGLLVYGFIAYRYGYSLSEVEQYIPEYEERIKKHLRVEKEIEIARESQYKLMPLQPPTAEGIDVYGFFMPSFEVGGDYFDYVMSEDDNGKPVALTMAVVDVSGKAMRAAMPAVFTSGLLLSRMKHDSPDKILTQVSEPIFSRTDKRTFITCVLARYNLESKKLSVANAGHCRPILKRNGVAEFIQTPDPKFPLGLKSTVNYKAHELVLKKGDFLLMYSDGLPEAANEKGDRFGFDEVPRLVEQIDTENLTAHEIAQEIKRTVQKFSNYQLVDDTTIICLKV